MDGINNFIQTIKKFQLPSLSSMQLCFDLGTSVTKIAIADKGIVLREPSVLGLNKRTGEFIFFGEEAKNIIGKVPDFIEIRKPMVGGIISDFDAEVAMVRKFVDKAITPYLSGYKLLKPNMQVIAAVPSVATEIEQKAVEEVLSKIGASRVYIVEKPLATSLGCGFDIFAHRPIFVIDIGGGLVEMAIISGGGTVVYRAMKNAGEHMNRLIYNYVYLKQGLILGETTCEGLKMKLLNFKDQEKTLIVRGKSLETGLPKSAKIKTGDIKESLLPNLNNIVDGVKELIELSPPEVVDDIYSHGVVLTGGMANTPGLDMFFTQELKIEAHTVDNPENSTILGLIKLARNTDHLHHLRVNLP